MDQDPALIRSPAVPVPVPAFGRDRDGPGPTGAGQPAAAVSRRTVVAIVAEPTTRLPS